MLCSPGLGCSQHEMDLGDASSPWQVPNGFVGHVSEKAQDAWIFGLYDRRSLSAVADSWIPQRGMLARLAAHINQGQMAVAGLGGGGEGAIVIDDNCTVSMSHGHGVFGDYQSRLLTRETRSCDFLV